jgi:hypothetical protein
MVERRKRREKKRQKISEPKYPETYQGKTVVMATFLNGKVIINQCHYKLDSQAFPHGHPNCKQAIVFTNITDNIVYGIEEVPPIESTEHQQSDTPSRSKKKRKNKLD